MSLKLQIENVRASGPPSRAIELECSVQGLAGNSRPIAIITAWINVTLQGRIQVEGPYFKQFHAPAGKAIFPGRGALYIPLNSSALDEIERHRQGDLEIRIDSRVLAAPVREVSLGGDTVQILEAAAETTFMHDGVSPVSFIIAQSKWINLLSQMRWSDLEIFEIPMEAFSSDENLKRAMDLLREAQKRFSRGDWPGVLQNCRQSFEAAAANVGQTSDKPTAFQRLVGRVGGGKKSDKLNDLLKAVSEFCHLGRHEDFPAVCITREDARAALRCALSIFALLGGRPD
ncbi:MAG: HEPN domain-containing protein [Nitrospira sp.]|nr:HEPN domain-containing protein [Nitrospira sp.]